MMKKYFLVLLLFSTSVMAKTFTSQFCEFVLPNGWNCQLEGSEWVCQSSIDGRKKEAIIILAAKLRGKQDTLGQYQSYLKQVKTFKLPGGKTQVSEPVYTKQIKIATQNHAWIDSLHMASEVPGFYTRYLATVKGELGVAVTFSVAKDHYNSYKPIFDKIVETLKVFSQKKKGVGNFKLAKGNANSVPGAEGDFIDDEAMRHDIGMQKNRKGGAGGLLDGNMLYILLAAGAAAAVIAMKKKGGSKKKGKKKKKKKDS